MPSFGGAVRGSFGEVSRPLAARAHHQSLCDSQEDRCASVPFAAEGFRCRGPEGSESGFGYPRADHERADGGRQREEAEGRRKGGRGISRRGETKEKTNE